MSELREKAKLFCHAVAEQFISRTNVEGKKTNKTYNVHLDISLKENTLFFTFKSPEESHTFTIPMPFYEDGALIIEHNEVKRALCSFLLKAEDRIVDYFAAMSRILFGEPAGLVPRELMKKVPFIQQIVYSFDNKNTAVIIHNLQRSINEVINHFPLHDTPMKSWAMNRRLVIIDPEFDAIQDPEKKLAYHVEKSLLYFDRGWTTIGLSDGSLADKNYILTEDLRKYTPFGEKHHNPQRNLYSTLGMKGDELPLIRTESMQRLIEAGITRKGWNLFTVFVDVPDVFEDQILVDRIHCKKFITLTKRYQCFGMLRVQEGERIKKWQTLAISDKGIPKKCDITADFMRVAKITETSVNVGGAQMKAHNIIIEYRRYLRDGVKITNMHGNKGVIRMMDLGHAVDPRTGELRKIDVIVSAKSVRKRKNFGQLFEALANNLWDDAEKPIVFKDDAVVNLQTLKEKLVAKGFPEDGTWMCNTHAGQLTGIAGLVFWGVTASVENAVWEEDDTVRVNNRLLRTAGIKFSHVELRAIQTRFGKNNPVYDEIMQYFQGSSDLQEYLQILRSKRGELPAGRETIRFSDLKAIEQKNGTVFDESSITGSIVDTSIHPEGFILELPITYYVMLNGKNEVIHEGAGNPGALPQEVARFYAFDKIYVPNENLRRCWQHDTGRYGLSEVGVLLNNIMVMCHRHNSDPTNTVHLLQLYKSIHMYFHKIAVMMGTKRGEISTLGMSVRYPFSAKAVATLSNRLPKDVVEIHEEMAETLGVKSGDIVLVERFPCLGFMSVRPQKVQVTKDEMCRYTIRVSGNCLCSLGLDFDGDVIYLASFHTPAAKEALKREWENPQPDCYDVICKLNEKAGKPHVACLSLDDYDIHAFEPLTKETHAELVRRATGVKSHTGPVIALAYNLMRIIENSRYADDQKVNIAVEVFLDRVGNTIFKQKHGVKSLHSIVVDAICTANVETLVEHGFERQTSEIICSIVREKAAELGVQRLDEYHARVKERGGSNIINRIVRTQNRIYFASRATLEGLSLLEALESKPVDIPSAMFHHILNTRPTSNIKLVDEHVEKRMLNKLRETSYRRAAEELFRAVEAMCIGRQDDPCIMVSYKIRKF